MNYQLVISPTLNVSVADFIAGWNSTAACREAAQAQRADPTTASFAGLDPTMLQQGLIFLAGVAGTVALEVIKDLVKERLKAYLEGQLAARQPEIEVEAIEQPDGAYLLVVKEKE
jgi:hypothetical protein